MEKITQTTELTQKQRDVLQQVNDFLQQFSDRDQMQAGYYLAKYKGRTSCEDLATPLRWAIQREFNNVG